MSDRRAELEKKRIKLAQLKEEKERRKREKELSLQGVASDDRKKDPNSDLRSEADRILESLGLPSITAEPLISPTGTSTTKPQTDAKDTQESLTSPIKKKPVNLTVVNVHDINIPPKESVTYNKQTQTSNASTDREDPLGYSRAKASLDYYEWEDEFQVLTYDDNEDEGEGSSLPYGTPPIYHKAARSATGSGSVGLPHVAMVEPAKTVQDNEATEETQKSTKKKRELTEEEKMKIITNEDFVKALDRVTKIAEKALLENESSDIFIDYTGANKDLDTDDQDGSSLNLNRVFFDEKWSKNRTITSFDWSAIFPELLLAAYSNNEQSPNDPDGICLIWNTKFKKTTPEYILHSQTQVVSACFAKFHANLIVGGTYSGQIVLWDNRTNRRTPVQRSPLSASAHTQPIYCIQVVGTQNAHNLITISTDGRLCSWSLDMLSAPQDTMELVVDTTKQRHVPVTCASFPLGDYNNFIIGSEEGLVYTACRHGSKPGILSVSEAHHGPVTSVDCHQVHSQVDFSHLFLTSSFDWTVKLWSNKDRLGKPLYSFEDNFDYVYDVRWSPMHPAVFATCDGTGRLQVWNLNQHVELPTTTVTVEGNPALNRVTWTPSGNQVAAGDDYGKIWIYDVGEQLYVPKGDEFTRLMRTLHDMKNDRVEAELSDSSSDLAYNSMPPNLSTW